MRRTTFLDYVNGRDDVLRAHVDLSQTVLREHVARTVARASLGFDHEAEVARLGRLGLVALVHLIDPIGDHVDANVVARRAARSVDPLWRPGPIRRAELDARRASLVPFRHDAPKLVQGGRIPLPESIGRMTPAEMNLLLRRFGASRDRDAMLREAIRQATSRLAGTRRPSDAVREQVLTRAEAAVRRELQLEAKELARDYHLAALGAKADTPLRWVAVGDDWTCSDCDRLDGRVQTLAEWRDDIMPGSADLECGGQCRCDFDEA